MSTAPYPEFFNDVFGPVVQRSTAPAAQARKVEYQRWFEQSKPAERPPACAI